MAEQREVLLGRWETSNDGGIHVLYGSAIEFEADGSGTIYGWGGSDDENDPEYDYKNEIVWSRIDKKTIQIKKITDEVWTVLEYLISEIQDPYNVKIEKMVSTPFHFESDWIKEWFWYIPEALYRQIRY